MIEFQIMILDYYDFNDNCSMNYFLYIVVILISDCNGNWWFNFFFSFLFRIYQRKRMRLDMPPCLNGSRRYTQKPLKLSVEKPGRIRWVRNVWLLIWSGFVCFAGCFVNVLDGMNRKMILKYCSMRSRTKLFVRKSGL